ncbi:PREDICTED: uncharacterized protein LOC106542458 [Thamnophis sirtalis]|uniref:Uncharacterized protein LOC106542458 n=1 Tax=Thamnophis sirtalis TaxID=35019 RepID=A0A6I9XHV3_9SAUR|nr:PREDICTED: uncharacterized protein LOC106542458 [Thamnophis sirtalis]
MSSRMEVEDGMEMYVCRVDGFYPREIYASWRRGGEEWLKDTFHGSVAPNADGTYHYWLSIRIDPKESSSYWCHVEHDGLQEPLDVALKAPKSNKGFYIGYLVAGLVLACVIVGTLVFFKKRQDTFRAAPDSEGSGLEEDGQKDVAFSEDEDSQVPEAPPITGLFPPAFFGSILCKARAEDKKAEIVLRKTFQAVTWAIRAAAAASFFNTSSALWLEQLHDRTPASDVRLLQDIKKLMAAATQFSDDATLDAVNSAGRAKRDLNLTIDTLRTLRFSINQDKSYLTPSTRLQHLGAIIDSMECEVFLSQEPLTKGSLFRELDRLVLTTDRDSVQMGGTSAVPDSAGKMDPHGFEDEHQLAEAQGNSSGASLQQVRLQMAAVVAAVLPTVQRSVWFSFSEVIIQALLCSDDIQERKAGVQKIIDLRGADASAMGDFSERARKTPLINARGSTLLEPIGWSEGEYDVQTDNSLQS